MAKRLHTHYDNLQVAHDASPEAIRAAYRALCKKYHPDQNRQNPDANRIMSLINRSYYILSDPKRRSAHDQWIAARTAKQDPEKIASPMPGGFRKVQEPLPYAKLAVWLLSVGLAIAALAYYTAQQRQDAPFAPPPPQKAAAHRVNGSGFRRPMSPQTTPPPIIRRNPHNTQGYVSDGLCVYSV